MVLLLQTGSVATVQQRPVRHTGLLLVQVCPTGQSASASQALTGPPLQRLLEQLAPTPQAGVPATHRPVPLLQVSVPLQPRPSLQAALPVTHNAAVWVASRQSVLAVQGAPILAGTDW